MIHSTALRDGWTLNLADGGTAVPPHLRAALPIPATVPGVVHTDLLAAGLVPDPYLDENELTLDWIGRTAWRYERELPTVPEGEAVLAFDGLDTLATVLVDGAEVARTENQHRRYEFPLGAALRGPGGHRLEVRFDPVWDFLAARERETGPMPRAYPSGFNLIRKSACNFGWDWGPALVTAGIWREARLLVVDGPRLARVSPHVTVEGRRGVVHLSVALAEPADRPLWLVVRAAGQEAAVALDAGERDAEARLVVDDPPLWWPHGLGGQPLVDVSVELLDPAGGEPLDRWADRVGFRSLRLVTEPDDEGTPFRFEIDGATVPIRGANWIPDDCFPSRVDAARLDERLRQAVDANVNLLRVWGGGVYESDEFYRRCDELGILVWQDFLFACASYPEDDRLAREVEAEVRDNVQRLLTHPSLVLWNGNNENIWGWFDWGWQPVLAGRPWGLGYYLELLPALVAEVDGTRPYWPGSPYSGTMAIHPNDDDHALRHIWDVWNELDYTTYLDYRPHFVSEFGWEGPPTWSTLTAAIHDEPLSPTSPGMVLRQKAADGNRKLERGLAHHVDVPERFEDWHFAMQLNQARAVTFGIEYFRSLRPRNTGMIDWQLNDCWPVTSWSAVDWNGRKKPVWYALRAAYATRLLTVQPRGEGLAVVAVDDGGEMWRETFVARRVRFDGTVLATSSGRFAVDRFGAASAALPDDVATPGSPADELVEVRTATGVRALRFFADDRDLAYPEPRLDATATRRGDVVEVELVARTLVRDLTIFADRVAPDAEVDDALVTLLPGERRVLRVTGVPAGREPELLAPPVLRTANDLVRVPVAGVGPA